MPGADEEPLIDLLDDALDELLEGDPGSYSENERLAFLRCYEHWLDGGLTDADIAFLQSQLHDYPKEEASD